MSDFHIDSELLKKIDRIAKDNGLSIQAVIHEAIDQYCISRSYGDSTESNLYEVAHKAGILGAIDIGRWTGPDHYSMDT